MFALLPLIPTKEQIKEQRELRLKAFLEKKEERRVRRAKKMDGDMEAAEDQN